MAEEENLDSAYTRKSKRLNKLRKDYKDLVDVEGKATNESKILLREIYSIGKELKRIDASVGIGTTVRGNYNSSLFVNCNNIKNNK